MSPRAPWWGSFRVCTDTLYAPLEVTWLCLSLEPLVTDSTPTTPVTTSSPKLLLTCLPMSVRWQNLAFPMTFIFHPHCPDWGIGYTRSTLYPGISIWTYRGVHAPWATYGRGSYWANSSPSSPDITILKNVGSTDYCKTVLWKIGFTPRGTAVSSIQPILLLLPSLSHLLWPFRYFSGILVLNKAVGYELLPQALLSGTQARYYWIGIPGSGAFLHAPSWFLRSLESENQWLEWEPSAKNSNLSNLSILYMLNKINTTLLSLGWATEGEKPLTAPHYSVLRDSWHLKYLIPPSVPPHLPRPGPICHACMIGDGREAPFCLISWLTISQTHFLNMLSTITSLPPSAFLFPFLSSSLLFFFFLSQATSTLKILITIHCLFIGKMSC